MLWIFYKKEKHINTVDAFFCENGKYLELLITMIKSYGNVENVNIVLLLTDRIKRDKEREKKRIAGLFDCACIEREL